MSSVCRSACYRVLLLVLIPTVTPLSAGSLSVSGVPGTIRYRVEHSEQLLEDWMEREVNAPGMTGREVFRDKRAAWISLFFQHAGTSNTRYVEVFVGAHEDVEMSFEWNPAANGEQLSVAYVGYPAMDFQLAYDRFTSDTPANHAMELASLKRAELKQSNADLNRIATRWVDEQLGLTTPALTTPAEVQPYRTRMTWRILHALCGMTHDGDVLSQLSQQLRDSLVFRAISSPPAFSENFRGRFWSGYMSVRAGLAAAIRPSSVLVSLPGAVTERCGEPGETIRTSFANLLVYANDDAFAYVYAAELQQHLETFARNPELFDREVGYFRCLFPESPYLQRLLH